jgi:hypothetical protein
VVLFQSFIFLTIAVMQNEVNKLKIDIIAAEKVRYLLG